MLTPINGLEMLKSLRENEPDNLEAAIQLRDKLLLVSATGLALESAFKWGKDLPVGAVAAKGDWINGRYFASDRRTGYRQMHAEYMAVQDASLDIAMPRPDTIVVTIEPCDNCQDFLATVPGLKRVGFGLTRNEVAERGLVKPHDENIFDRVKRLELPYEVVQIDNPFWLGVGGIILDNTKRNPLTESVEVNAQKLNDDLAALEAA